MAPIPPVAGSASAAVPNTAANAIGAMQGGGDQQQDQIQQLAEQIREVSGSVDELGATNPTLASEVAQIKQILRSMLVKAASAASAQSPSSLAVPMGQ